MHIIQRLTYAAANSHGLLSSPDDIHVKRRQVCLVCCVVQGSLTEPRESKCPHIAGTGANAQEGHVSRGDLKVRLELWLGCHCVNVGNG